jgi:hypothetical protein
MPLVRWLAATAAAALASSCRSPVASAPRPPARAAGGAASAAGAPAAAARDPRSLAAAGYASVVCSAVFLQGRDPAEAGRNSTAFVVNDADRPTGDRVEVDRARREVRASARGGPVRVARVVGEVGCVTLPEGEDGIHFDPAWLGAAPLPPSSEPWLDLVVVRTGHPRGEGAARKATKRALAAIVEAARVERP